MVLYTSPFPALEDGNSLNQYVGHSYSKTYKSPQRVMLIMSCWGEKRSDTLQEDPGHAADGVPQVDGSTDFAVSFTLDGTLFLCA